MSKEYEDLMESRRRFDAARTSSKPNAEQIQAHFCDVIAKARTWTKETEEWAKEQLKRISGASGAN